MSIIEDQARSRKVSALVETLAQAGATAAGMEFFTPSAWQLAADCANVRTPSEQTSRQVIAALQLRETPVDDPFASFDHDEVAA